MQANVENSEVGVDVELVGGPFAVIESDPGALSCSHLMIIFSQCFCSGISNYKEFSRVSSES